MDLSHLTGQEMPERAASPGSLPSEWDWRDEGKVTPVKDQGSCVSGYAFATIAGFESKILIDNDNVLDFSENHAKECNWRELNDFEDPPGTPWGSCDGGDAKMLASLFSQTGTVRDWCDQYVDSDVDCNTTCPYEKTLLDWRIISEGSIPDTGVLKQYIYDHGPVIASMYADAGQGFNSSYDGSYTFSYTVPGDSTNHLVLIVGWSDSLPTAQSGTGLADGWIVKNHSGTGWGDDGYFYITYGAGNIGMDSSYVYDWQDYDLDGGIWYYDDDGWTTSLGCGDLDAYALARFIPDENTWATRVELWTVDAASIDIYLYDDFDGSIPTNLLALKTGSTFSEAGYHSVALDEPVPVTSGDDINVMVRVTNASSVYPIAADFHGPIETGRTYFSCNLPSWQDLGAVSSSDAAIRLRTSTGSKVMLAKTVINNDGGKLSEIDFRPYVGSNPVSWNTRLSLTAGTHVFTETLGVGYEAQDWGGDCEPDGTLATAPGGEYNCSITNNDIAPTVTLTKTVVNDDGGTLTEDDFQPYIDGLAVSWETPVAVLSGTVTVSETKILGYAASVWAGSCEPDGTLAVEVGGVYTCTIINDDYVLPTVTLTKTVVNDNDGTLTRDDFYPYIDGESVLWGMSIPLSPGSHTVTETEAPDYTASDWAGACEPDGTLTVEAGGIYTCSIVNDDYASTFVYLPLVERQ
jgi:C1A family cysteine protease